MNTEWRMGAARPDRPTAAPLLAFPADTPAFGPTIRDEKERRSDRHLIPKGIIMQQKLASC